MMPTGVFKLPPVARWRRRPGLQPDIYRYCHTSANPTSGLQAATKQYVDGIVMGRTQMPSSSTKGGCAASPTTWEVRNCTDGSWPPCSKVSTPFNPLSPAPVFRRR